MTKDRIEAGSLGWTHPSWDNDYYPEDLPEDWRLDYYSHHFQVILMQTSEWLQASEDDAAQWLVDVKDSFVFFLAIEPQALSVAAIKQLGLINAVLGERLQGLVIFKASHGLQESIVEQLKSMVTVYVDADQLTGLPTGTRSCWRSGRDVTNCEIGFIIPDVAKNMRAMRAQIEEFLKQSSAEQLYLIYEGEPPSTKSMQDAQVIIQMLT